MMSCCINYTAHIKKQDYNVFIFNIDAEMLHNVQQEITALHYTNGFNKVGTRTHAQHTQSCH